MCLAEITCYPRQFDLSSFAALESVEFDWQVLYVYDGFRFHKATVFRGVDS